MSTLRRYGGLIVTVGWLGLAPLRAEPMTDDPGRFAVDIPSPIKHSDSEGDSALGKTTLHLIVHETADGKAAYFVGYNDYDPKQKLDVAKSYEGIIAAVVDSMKGKIRGKSEHKLGGVTGWEYILDNEQEKFVARVRCYLVDHRLYQTMYLGAPGTEGSKEALHFLDSFRLLR